MDTTQRLRIAGEPVSRRPFAGLGVQADDVIYNDQNRQAGVTEADCEMVESRIRALRPGIVRIFVAIDVFNPALDGRTYDWSARPYQNLLRHVRNLRRAGAKVNVCMGPGTNKEMTRDGMEATGLDLVERLRRVEGFDNVAWLTLFNEPDGIYSHDSPLYRRLFGEDSVARRPPWSRYVAKHRRTQEELVRRGLYPDVRLIVADTVWGHPMRTERLPMSVRDFGDLGVAYSYHNYSSEEPDFYANNADHRYPGMAEEARMFRGFVGAERELICWEFNNSGVGFGSHWPGTTMRGEDLLGTFDSAVTVSDKVLQAVANGIDGTSLWCVGDSFYGCSLPTGVMRFGLWRYKWEGWTPRPYWYYYAAMCHALRPGAQIVSLEGLGEGFSGVAARDGQGTAVVLLNRQATAATAELILPAGRAGRRLRVHPRQLPTADGMPVADWDPLPPGGPAVRLELEGRELTVVRV